MTSIGLSERHVRMFPSGMILLEMHPSEVTAPRKRALVEKYQELARALKEQNRQLSEFEKSSGRFTCLRIKLCNKRCSSIRKQMKRIEESKELSGLLFHKRYILVTQQFEMEKKLARERYARDFADRD